MCGKKKTVHYVSLRMDMTIALMSRIEDYVCPVHADMTFFKIDAHTGLVIQSCCGVCRDTIENMIAATDAQARLS